MQKAPVVMFVIIAATAGALAAAPGEYSSKEATECWSCHAPELWDPPMVDPSAGLVFEQRSGDWWLVADIGNTWTHELRQVNGIIEGVDGLVLRGEPMADSVSGSLDAMPGTEASDTHTISPKMGAGGLNITLTWESITPQDMRLQVTDAMGAELGSLDEDNDRIQATLTAEDMVAYEQEIVIQVTLFGQLPETVTYDIAIEANDGPMWARGTSAAPGKNATIEWPVDGIGNGTDLAQVTFYYETFYDHDNEEITDLGFARFSIFPEIASYGGQPYFAEPEVEEEEDEFLAPGPGVLVIPALAWAAGRRRR